MCPVSGKYDGVGYRVTVMVVGQSPSGTAFCTYNECALSQVDTHPDMILDVARKYTNILMLCLVIADVDGDNKGVWVG